MNDELTLEAALLRIVGILIADDLSDKEKIEQAFCAAKCALARHKMNSCESEHHLYDALWEANSALAKVSGEGEAK